MNIADRIQHLRKSNGISQEELTSDVSENIVDARVFSAVGTACNFIGLVTAVIIWIEERTPISVAIGFIVMAFGCMFFAIGQFVGGNKKKALLTFVLINIWFLSLIPISCVFNYIQGISGGYWWTFTPIPQLGNSISIYGMCWISYFMICAIFDIVIIKLIKQ